MTASNPENVATGSRLAISIVAALLGGCRPGLPPEPAGMDPVDPDAPIGRSEETPSPFEGSAFDDETLDAGEHDHGSHGGHGSHAGHGAPAPANAASHAKEHEHGSSGHHHHGGNGEVP